MYSSHSIGSLKFRETIDHLFSRFEKAMLHLQVVSFCQATSLIAIFTYFTFPVLKSFQNWHIFFDKMDNFSFRLASLPLLLPKMAALPRGVKPGRARKAHPGEAPAGGPFPGSPAFYFFRTPLAFHPPKARRR